MTKTYKKHFDVYVCNNTVQVTNVMPAHYNEQMPQLQACDDNDAFQIWGFTYALNFTMVPEYLTTYV